MQILYAHHREVPPIVPDAEPATLEALLERADVVSLHAPLSEQTAGLIDAAALRRMKPTALLINTARGPIVDTDALLEALRAGEIAGAALDVTDPEPLPPTHPLYAMDQVVIAPHIGSATHATRQRMAALAIDNVLAGVRGATLPHAVLP